MLQQEATFKHEKELSTGWFKKPHGLITLLREGHINKSEYILLDFLLSFQNHHKREDGTFYCSDKIILATKLLSSKKIVEARYGLRMAGLINFKKGHSHHATDYVILIPAKCFDPKPTTVEK